jgi:hypothetical protein
MGEIPPSALPTRMPAVIDPSSGNGRRRGTTPISGAPCTRRASGSRRRFRGIPPPASARSATAEPGIAQRGDSQASPCASRFPPPCTGAFTPHARRAFQVRVIDVAQSRRGKVHRARPGSRSMEPSRLIVRTGAARSAVALCTRSSHAAAACCRPRSGRFHRRRSHRKNSQSQSTGLRPHRFATGQECHGRSLPGNSHARRSRPSSAPTTRPDASPTRASARSRVQRAWPPHDAAPADRQELRTRIATETQEHSVVHEHVLLMPDSYMAIQQAVRE